MVEIADPVREGKKVRISQKDGTTDANCPGSLSIRLVKASDLPLKSCGMSNLDVKSGIGEIDVLRSDEYEKLPGCLDGVSIPRDQLNTVIHEVLHMAMNIPVTEEGKVVAISEVIEPRTRRHK